MCTQLCKSVLLVNFKDIVYSIIFMVVACDLSLVNYKHMHFHSGNTVKYSRRVGKYLLIIGSDVTEPFIAADGIHLSYYGQN